MPDLDYIIYSFAKMVTVYVSMAIINSHTNPTIKTDGYWEPVLNWYHFLTGQYRNIDTPLHKCCGIYVTLIQSNISDIFLTVPQLWRSYQCPANVWCCVTACLHSMLSSHGWQGKRAQKCSRTLLDLMKMQLHAICEKVVGSEGSNTSNLITFYKYDVVQRVWLL